MLELGSLIGALIAGIFADRFSRRQAIMLACGKSQSFPFAMTMKYSVDFLWGSSCLLCRVCSAILCPKHSSFDHWSCHRGFRCRRFEVRFLTSGRIISPLRIEHETDMQPFSMLSPLYMAEISPPEVRGSLMALEQFSIVLGAVLGFWTGFFTRDCMGSSFKVFMEAH